MQRTRKTLRGFTLIELTVSMFVIAILAGVVLTGARGMLHRQRFNDAQEHFRSMVLTARNRSQTKTDGASSVGVHIPVGSSGDIVLFEDSNPKDSQLSPADPQLEVLPINAKDFSVSVAGNTPCTINARIIFTTGDSAATLYCDQQSDQILKINFQSAVIESSIQKFMILKEAGILQ